MSLPKDDSPALHAALSTDDRASWPEGGLPHGATDYADEGPNPARDGPPMTRAQAERDSRESFLLDYTHPDHPGETYQTIVADPPWPYQTPYSRTKGGRFGDGTSGSETACLAYPTMPLAEIAELPVASLADRDAWLWLWTTDRFLPEAFGVAKAWGFEYRQTFVWHKSDGHPRFPTTIAPIRSEYLLLCRRGSPRRTGTVASNVLDVPFNPARMRHSQKPDAFYDLIESVVAGPYLELFARRDRLGWDTWGDESLGTAELRA